ncbi:MAG: DUF3990 domain-containing protein [Methylobacteriaceae bacterium]|jgi:hypothetical protein|nr:DUF3990 domain-containing protein [Methylobacteriaceae bacterium]
MILYHGSSVAVERPDLAYARAMTDFGRGFYTTPLKDQAIPKSAGAYRECIAGATAISPRNCAWS